MEKELKRYYGIFGFLCCLVYFTSYITRINLGAIVAEIVETEGIAKSSISFALLMGFISYGAGQLISGALGDKFNPIKLISAGFAATAACNLLIPFSTSVFAMSAVWLLNGFAQAMMWPPLMKLMTRYLEEKQFSKTAVNVSAASSAGTIFVYLTAPVFIELGGWRTMFYFSAAAAVAVLVIWNAGMPGVIKKLPQIAAAKPETAVAEVKMRDIIKKYGLVFICIAIVFQGILRDGITTWLPSCIAEVFDIEAKMSILVSVVLPVFSIAAFKLFGIIQQRFVKNEVRISVYLFAVAAVLCVSWAGSYADNVVLSLLQAAIIGGFMHGINFMLICIVPKRFADCGKVSLISGLLNFFTYVGSAISTYGIAKISELFGWQITILVWAAIAAGGILMCAVCVKKFSRN